MRRYKTIVASPVLVCSSCGPTVISGQMEIGWPRVRVNSMCLCLSVTVVSVLCSSWPAWIEDKSIMHSLSLHISQLRMSTVAFAKIVSRRCLRIGYGRVMRERQARCTPYLLVVEHAESQQSLPFMQAWRARVGHVSVLVITSGQQVISCRGAYLRVLRVSWAVAHRCRATALRMLQVSGRTCHAHISISI